MAETDQITTTCKQVAVITSEIYDIGGVGIKFDYQSPFLMPENQYGSAPFRSATKQAEWTIKVSTATCLKLDKYAAIFNGAEQFDIELPYKWRVLQQGNQIAIHVELEKHPQISEAAVIINEERQEAEMQIVLKKELLEPIDPFFHPIGILLIQYIIHLHKGIVMHASAVYNHEAGYLFTAVSGTGKSTMARLWQKEGFTIINDDRVIIRIHEDGIRVYNTPMPYYMDAPKNSPLTTLFLIKQSPHNYIEPLSHVKATLALLGNCMQYQVNAQKVNERLQLLDEIASRIGVYETGFKPDQDIVTLIHSRFG